MKIAKLILLLVILLSPLLVNAYQGQYPWNPIYFEEVKDPLDTLIDSAKKEKSTNQETINRLKSWYGITSYYDCYNETDFPEACFVGRPQVRCTYYGYLKKKST